MANPEIVTTDTTVYPSENQIEVTQFEGSRGQEKTHAKYVEAWAGDHIESGLTTPATHGDLDFPVASGVAIVDGRRVEMELSNDITLAPSTTNHIYLQLLFDGSDNTSTVQLVANTTGIPPADSVKLAVAVTDATTVTAAVETRVIDPYRKSTITGHSLNMKRAFLSPAGVGPVAGTETTVWTHTITKEDLNGIAADILMLWSGDWRVIAGAFPTTVSIRIKLNGTTLHTHFFANLVAGTTERSPRSLHWLYQSLDPTIDNIFSGTLQTGGVTSVEILGHNITLMDIGNS